MLNRIIVLAFTAALALPSLAQERYSRVEIKAPADRAAFAALAGLLQLDHFDYTPEGAIVTELSQSDINRLRLTPYQFRIVSEDIVAELEEQNRQYFAARAAAPQGRLPFEETGGVVSNIIKTPAAFQVQSSLGGYYSFAQMVAAMNQLVADYPDLVTMTSLGKTANNRDIWVIKISDNPTLDEEEPEVLFMGLQHAREAIGGASMIFMMQYLCEQYTQDQRIRDLVDNREIFIIPCMNPDGWVYNQSTNPNGGGQWRKNRNGNGVDLNRNWGVDWGNCSAPIVGNPGSCGSSSSNQDTYYGPSAFSEKETQIVRDFTYSRKLVAMIDQHAYGPYYSLPFGRPSLSSNVMTYDESKFYTWVPAAMGKYNGMRAGNSPESVGYEVAGGVKDWMLRGDIGVNGKGRIFGMTGEGGYGTSSTSGTFWPPAAQIIRLCKGMVYQNLQLLFAAGVHIDHTDLSPLVLSSKTGNISFRALRVGLGSGLVTVSLLPLENIQSVGAPVTITSANLPAYYSNHTASISYTLPASLQNGQRIRYAWKIEEGGLTFYDTITRVYHSNPATIYVVNDNMEGADVADNWQVNSGWGFTSNGTGYGGSGRAFSESPSGNYPGSASRTATWRHTIDLSNANAAYLSFWIRHRIENFRDKLQVLISTNGTSGPWIPLKGNITIQEPGTLEGSSINGEPSITGIREEWVRAFFDLSEYTGMGFDSLRLRFHFTSDGASSSGFAYRQDDGVYIDDVQLIQTIEQGSILPVRFISFQGRLLNDESIRLDWKAEADLHHDYFEVEKMNGNVFVSLGRGPQAAPYYFVDPNPVVGSNYYRIKQVDKDGKVTYSNTISVMYKPTEVSIRFFPNPVNDQMRIRLSATQSSAWLLTLTDLSGKTIYQEKLMSPGGSQEWIIPMQGLASQMYLVTLRNGQGKVVVRRKAVKRDP